MTENEIDWTKFDGWQMSEIRLGLEKGIDVSVYARPMIEWEEMLRIRRRLENSEENK